MPTYFVTGTDTDAGKTLVCCAILTAAGKKGYSTAALKPVAAGVIESAHGNQNEDVLALTSACSLSLSFKEMNPVCFPEPVAPHVGASKAGQTLQARTLAQQCLPVIDKQADLTLVEGAGGWKVPLNNNETMADLVKELDMPVILVVGMRLGCLNHALLTAQAILADGLSLHGWIANRIDPDMQAYTENLETLKTMMPAPMLAEIPWTDADDKVSRLAGGIEIDRFME